MAFSWQKSAGVSTPYFLLLVSLPLASAAFLYLEHLTHVEFLNHAAAIPLEILVGVLLVERFLAHTEKKKRARQLMFIKSWIFRAEMRNVFLMNFDALQKPNITINSIKEASLHELKTMRDSLSELTYRSDEQLEGVLEAYVKAYSSFRYLLEWALQHDFESIFSDMVLLLHFIQDVKVYKMCYPDESFIKEAKRDEELMEKVNIVLRDGLTKFLDYVIEIRQKEPGIYEALMRDYQHSSNILKHMQTSSSEKRLLVDPDTDLSHG